MGETIEQGTARRFGSNIDGHFSKDRFDVTTVEPRSWRWLGPRPSRGQAREQAFGTNVAERHVAQIVYC